MQKAIEIINEEINKIRPQDYESIIICQTLNNLKKKLENVSEATSLDQSAQTVGRFRKKPVIIESIQYREDNNDEVAKFLGMKEFEEFTTVPPCIDIETLEGVMTARQGDWIIKEPFPTNDRNFYPCKPDIFEQTYEPVK